MRRAVVKQLVAVRGADLATVPSADLLCDAEGEAGAELPATDCADNDAAIGAGATEALLEKYKKYF